MLYNKIEMLMLQKYHQEGTSLVIHWLDSVHPLQGAWVLSLVIEIRSYIPHTARGSAKKKKKFKK